MRCDPSSLTRHKLNDQRFEFDLTNAPRSLIPTDPGQSAIALLLEFLDSLFYLDLENIDNARHDLTVIERLQIGVASYRLLPNCTTNSRFLQSFNCRSLMEFLVLHRPPFRNDPPTAFPRRDHQYFDLTAIRQNAVTKSRYLLSERTGE